MKELNEMSLKPEDKSIQVEAQVSDDFCDFTPKQLNIIGTAIERWLREDTIIRYDAKNNQHYIDKINGNPTISDRLREASKNSR